MNKKGLELSLTVIVVVIISIIILIGGIALVWKIFAGAEEIKAGIDKQTRDQIEAMLREGTELVAIPINTKAAPAGKDAVFGLGIRNIHQTQEFYVRIDFEGIYDSKGYRLDVFPDPELIEREWLGGFQELGPITIERNKYEVVPLRIRAGTMISSTEATPRNSLAVFNVCVFPNNPGGECGLANKEVYDRINQVFVKIK
ncbi:MAG: hypothetical protein QXT19_00990 [Candidatus Woesearchaeota archaeon]